MVEVNGRWLRARVHPDGSRVEGLAVFGLDLEAVAGKESRFPTTSSAALPSRSAFVAVQLPCSFFWASSAGCAKAGTSQVPRINQHIAEVSRCIILLLS